MKFGYSRITVAALGIGVVSLLGAALVRGQAGQAPRPQMSEEVFKNVQILKGIPVDEFMDTMGMFASALALNCIDCHTSDSVGTWDNFAKETQLKQTSRKMLLMVNAINKDNFGGVRAVTCYTCHRADSRPKPIPNLAAQYAEHVEDANEVQINRIPGGPTVDQVFDKYIQALGGAQRLGAITSFAGKGTFIGFETEQSEVPVDVYAKSPNQRATVVHTQLGDSVRVFDGRAGWIASPDRPVPLLTLTGGNLEGAKIDATLAFPTQIKGLFSQWRVTATGIDDREVRVLQGTNPRQPPVNFYFDAETGLLMRVLRYVDTAVGRVPTQIDLSDYREVSGVKTPFKWIVTWTNGQGTTQLRELQANVAIDAAKLARPAPAKPPQ